MGFLLKRDQLLTHWLFTFIFLLSTTILTCPSQVSLFIIALIAISDRQCFWILQLCENCTLAFSVWAFLKIRVNRMVLRRLPELRSDYFSLFSNNLILGLWYQVKLNLCVERLGSVFCKFWYSWLDREMAEAVPTPVGI